VHGYSTPRTTSQPPILIKKHVGFEMALSHLKVHIFTLAFTFHHTTIDYHNLKIIYGMEITMGLFGHLSMNKNVGVVVLNQSNHFVIFM
jgi:hypothetical protein